MTIIKVSFENEIRRFSLPEESDQLFALLVKALNESFRVSAEEIRITYLDDEGDRCIVGGNDELREAIRFFKEFPVKLSIEKLLKAIEAPNKAAEPPQQAQPAPAPAPPSLAEYEESTPPMQEEVAVEPFVVEPFESKEEYAVRCGSLSEPAAAAASSPAPEQEPAPVLVPSVQFVRDVTLPDGSVQRCGTAVLKIWEIRNNGECAWPENGKLVLSKEKEQANKTRIRFNKEVPVFLPALAPGATCEVSVELKLPMKQREGQHQIFFELVTPDNQHFAGDYLLFADLIVQAPLPALTKQQFLRSVPLFLTPPEANGVVDDEVHAALTTLLEQNPGTAVHTNIRCDGCEQFPLKGPRFHCTVCNDFDLCEACEAKGQHPVDHPLMKMQRPRRQGASASPQRPPHRFHHHVGGLGRHGGGGLSAWLQRLTESMQPFATALASAGLPPRPQPQPQPTPAAPQPQSTASSSAPAAAAAEEYDALPELVEQKEDDMPPLIEMEMPPKRVVNARADFVQDLNLPDGSEVSSGTFTKKWAVKNTGRTAWVAGTTLVCVDHTQQVTVGAVSVPEAQPDQTVEVSVEVTPLLPGRVVSYFRLFNPTAAEGNRRFGPKIWLDVTSVRAATPSPPSTVSSASFSLPLFTSAAAASAEPVVASTPTPTPAQAEPVPFGLPLLNMFSFFTPSSSSSSAPAVVASPASPTSTPIPAPASPKSTPIPEQVIPSAPTPVAAAVSTPTPAPSAAPAPAPFLVLPVDESFPTELRQLYALGFTDLDTLRPMLLAANGNVQRVVNWLLSGQ